MTSVCAPGSKWDGPGSAPAQIAVATTAATMVFLYLFAGHLLQPYDTTAGQGWLVVVMAVFFGAGLMLVRYSRLEVPERFTLRHPPQPQAADR